MISVFKHPNPRSWSTLSKRPDNASEKVQQRVHEIMQSVKEGGDASLSKWTRKLDGVGVRDLVIRPSEKVNISDSLKKAIHLAFSNIQKYHKHQIYTADPIETSPGITCWSEFRPIERVGLYVPGGSAPLFSSLLMLGIPAKIAGCSKIVVCTPPDEKGSIPDVINYTAAIIGIDTIYCVGGAQAIAAMTFGTESIPKVDKIFGPGNAYVTKAKQLATLSGTAIDMPAGPSELLIIADDSAKATYVAADLLSQAEHGSDSQVILVTDSAKLIEDVKLRLDKQLQVLPRKKIALEALKNSCALLFDDLKDAFAFSNTYAPEHLIVACRNATSLTRYIKHAGSIFLGHLACESLGDYATGTNHTLPTNGFAKSHSGVSVYSFMKRMSFQTVNENGIKAIGKHVEIMADQEGLAAHKNAVTVRLNDLAR